MKTIKLSYIQEVLNNTDPKFIEGIAKESKKITQQYFGRTISLYAPLYLSNYCSSQCTYCGFGSQNRINRFKLTHKEIQKEMDCISTEGIENILLLTGESYKATPLSYLEDAVTIAKNYFPNISLEIHPLEENEYHKLFLAGVDGLTIYQETYNKNIYKQVHLSGKKADYNYRLQTPLRAANAGIRSISLGILLGLSEASEDLFCLFSHLNEMEKTFPGIEYSFSFPRLRPKKGQKPFTNSINNATFTKIICLARILFPRVGINLSTRESANFRNHALEFGITKISAGSNTSVGGYTLKNIEEQNPQFDIEDTRSVNEMIKTLKNRQFDPVLTDWRRIENE